MYPIQLLCVHEGCEMNDSNSSQHGLHVFLVTLFTLAPGRSQPNTQRVPAIKQPQREATPIVEINKARNSSFKPALLHVTQ